MAAYFDSRRLFQIYNIGSVSWLTLRRQMRQLLRRIEHAAGCCEHCDGHAKANSNGNGSSVAAVVYFRMPSDKQEVGIPEQRAAVECCAADHGYHIIGEYVDSSVSGDATHRRREIQRIIADAECGNFKTILCCDRSWGDSFDCCVARLNAYLPGWATFSYVRTHTLSRVSRIGRSFDLRLSGSLRLILTGRTDKASAISRLSASSAGTQWCKMSSAPEVSWQAPGPWASINSLNARASPRANKWPAGSQDPG